jgi:hypothetical protein
MNPSPWIAATAACLFASSVQSSSAADLTYEWYTAANNADPMPTGPSVGCVACHDGAAAPAGPVIEDPRYFNSYNQPAISKQGVVVFRARSRGGQAGAGAGGGEPERGIYKRDLAVQGPLNVVFRRRGTVPQPNNTGTGPSGDFATFNEFPSVPRIDAGSDTMATRGQSTPVWSYLAPNGVETRTGTAGVYVGLHGLVTTGTSMLGDVFELDAAGVVSQTFRHFQVPPHGNGAVGSGIGFDQFPGSPAVTERTMIVFKGNFTVGGIGRTGVFYRDALARGGMAPVELIASSYTRIPRCWPDLGASPPRTCLFGSTAPPSAGGMYAVFAGYDDESAPTQGGLYRARIGVKPVALQTVVKIGDPVPGEPRGTRFEVFGEAVSVSSTGRTILFWGGWGGKRSVRLVCPGEGSAALRAACEAATNDAEEEGEDTLGQVPAQQGFFARDMQLGTTTVIAKTGDAVDGSRISDFVYWNFSGRVAGAGEPEGDDIEEPARWRSATFGAVSGNGVPIASAVKARTDDGEDGIYLRRVLPAGPGATVTLLKTGELQVMDANPRADGMLLSAIGIERDGFRGSWLAVTATMVAPPGAAAPDAGDAGEVAGWAGVYAARFLDDGFVGE